MIFVNIVILLIITVLGYGVRKKLREISSVDLFDFLRRFFSGAVERDLKPGALQKIINNAAASPLLIDLREPDVFAAAHIAGAMSIPFDDFMHEVLVNERYTPEEKMILICDHGVKSKVAADILGKDEGFTSVFSVRGGMEAWNKLTQKESCCTDFLQKKSSVL